MKVKTYTRQTQRYEATSGDLVRVSAADSGEIRVLRTVPDAFMVTLAHRRSKRGSSRAEPRDVICTVRREEEGLSA